MLHGRAPVQGGKLREMAVDGPFVTPARRSFRFAIFKQTCSNLPRFRCRQGSVSPYRARPVPAQPCCCAPSRTLIPVKVCYVWTAATARRSPDPNGRLIGYVPAEPCWWAETVGEYFSEWTAALAFVRDLGFPEEARAWPIICLSTGERHLLALIRALMARPKVLLLDEPTAALDPGSVTAVGSLIAARVHAGLAVLWVTHDSGCSAPPDRSPQLR